MSWTLTEQHTLVTEICCDCHMLFAMPEAMQRRRRNDHEYFYCPSGHPQHYTGKSDAEKLREAERRLASREEDLRIERNRMENERRSHAATKGQLTRARKKVERAEKGVCTECHRSFENVARHMATKHPDVHST